MDDKIDNVQKKRWDRADYLLIGAVIFFLVTLWLKIQNPGNIFLEGAHFVADAALVGGIADWFAVTAIFEHPFGIHIPNTAILPNKKTSFANGAASFVKGLLKEETVISEIRGMNILAMISSKLKDSERREIAIDYLLDLIRDRLDEANRSENIREISNVIRQKLMDYRARELVRHGLHWLKSGDNGAMALEWVAPILKQEVNSQEFREMLEATYKDLRENKVTGIRGALVSIGEAMNIVNLDDASEVTQSELLNMVADLGVRGSETQRRVLRLIFEKADDISRDRRLLQSLDEFRKKLIDKMPLEEGMKEIFSKFWHNFKDEETRKKISTHTEKALRSHIAEVLRNQFTLVLDLLRNDADLQEDLDTFLKEITSSFATDVARPKVAKIVKRVLDNMSDDRLNEVVRSKVKDDLMFIRINGVIVGAIIGGLLFVGIQLYSKFSV